MDDVHRDTGDLVRLESGAILDGLIAGFLAAIPMGLILQFGTDLLPVLGSFLGETSLLRGWIVHLLIGLGYGASFAIFVAYPPIHDFLPSLDTAQYVALAVTYTVMVAAFTISVLPFVTQLPWETAASNSPFLRVPGRGFGGLIPSAAFAIAHLVFGVVLGAVYAAAED